MSEPERSETPETSFSADRPIQHAKEDLLGRKTFSESIAAAISNWRGEQSLVVALYGAWGSGKSSIKNMVVETIEKLPEKKKPTVLPFNAWQFSGQEGLIEAFFRETGIALGIKDKSRQGQKLAAQWRSFAAFFRVVGSATTGSKAFIAALLFVTPPLTLGTVTWGKFGWTFGLIALVGCSALVTACSQFISRISDNISNWMSARAELSKTSLDEKRKELITSLKQRNRPLLVVIDDIDRLTASEIQLIFRLVKANLDLPKVAYLLLFQRDIVERALESLSPISGRDFLEKVVLTGFDVPAIERPLLDKVLTAGIDQIIEESNSGRTFSRKRWVNIFIPGLSPYFRTLRNVYRFLSTLRFHIAVLSGNDGREVNIVDLIGLEVLRLFEPEIFHGLQAAKNELTGQVGSADGSAIDDRVRTTVEHLLALGRPEHKTHAKEILEQLFPPIDSVFGFGGYGSDFHNEWYRDRRICSYDVFDRYFLLRIPQMDISHSEIEQVMSSTGNRNIFVILLRKFLADGRLETLLNRLDAYKETIDISVAEHFITGLFDIGDELPERAADFAAISSESYASRIIYWYLRKESDAIRRGQILRDAIQNTTGLFLPTFIVVKDETRKRIEDRLVGDSDLEALKTLCLRKIRTCADSNSLAKNPRLLGMLYTWQKWGGDTGSRAWVEKLN